VSTRKHLAAVLLGGALLHFSAAAFAGAPPTFTLYLKAGTFYGPGDKGIHPFNNAEVRNIVLTGPLQGFIPFANNGAELPNVIAEVLQGGVIDGHTSDGRPINENIDTGLRLVLKDPQTGESANVMVVSVEQEIVAPDEKGNLVFQAHVVADPGQPSLVEPFDVRFTSGAARVPLSLRTQNNTFGGHDFAGPFPSGHVLIGRIGDFDHDGFLDGELVQAENAPLNLVLAQGDPLAQRRPWVSDIPAPPSLSVVLNVNGIVQNFPEPLVEAFHQGRFNVVMDYGFDITGRLNAAIYDLNTILASKEASHKQRARARTARFLVRTARQHIERGLDLLSDSSARSWKDREAIISMQLGMKSLGLALLQLAQDAPQQSPKIDLKKLSAQR
jgi:hypothetical protein